MPALSRRTSIYLLLWVLVVPVYLLVVRMPGYAQPTSQQNAPCPGGPLENFVTGSSETGVRSPEVVANGEPMAGRWWEPGSRSYWHCHGGGQFILVMEGEGRAQKRGERKRELRVGEIEFALPGVEHWHGASPSSRARHINQSMSVDGGSGVFWMEEVSEADYSGNAIGIQSRNRFLETGER